jgi:hypothetical protein
LGTPAFTSDWAPIRLRVRPAQLTMTVVAGSGASSRDPQHQLGAGRADPAGDAHHRVFLEPAGVEDHLVGLGVDQGLDVLGGQRRRVPPRLDQFAERLAVGIDVLEQLVAGVGPACRPPFSMDIGVAERRQRLPAGETRPSPLS